MAAKKVPERMCIACGEMKPKKELIRIVKQGDEIFPDPTGKADGRGAYICANAECAALMIRKKSLNRAFKMNVGEAVYTALREKLEAVNGQGA